MAKTVKWRPEPKGPGRAFHMFLDAGGERVELLVYDCPASHAGPRMCGFEVYTRQRKGRPYHNQVGAGECETLEAAMRAALEMVMLKPRQEWAVLPRSWVK